ncbi:hypothetical protein B0H14DRAFT_2588343 [Mycena olivaceomarginata]|nr:hypothetical protein B0H14DRAFT_2588343 [Mycena olivaceomarginata]
MAVISITALSIKPTSTVGISPHHTKNTSSVIAIVGGGVFLLAVLGAIYVWYGRCQRRATGKASMFSLYPMSKPDTVRPFAQLSGPYATMGYFARMHKRGLGATGEVPRPS